MNAAKTVIRPMRMMDMPDIITLQCRIYEPFFHESQTAFQTKFTASPATCLVAECHGVIAGYIVSLPAAGDTLPALNAQRINADIIPDRLYLHDMAILPEYRNHGLGRRFLQALLPMAKEKQLKKIVLIAVRNSSSFWIKHHFQPPDILPEAIVMKLQSYGPGARYLERNIEDIVIPDTARLE